MLVLICFNYDTHAKVDVAQWLNLSAVVHDVFTADSLHYTVIYYLNKYSTYLWGC